jgi:hypothetical protein
MRKRYKTGGARGDGEFNGTNPRDIIETTLCGNSHGMKRKKCTTFLILNTHSHRPY